MISTITSARKISKRQINITTKKYGIDCKVYYPTRLESIRSGRDEYIEYEDDPQFDGKLLIPYFFSKKYKNFFGIDNLSGEEIILYTNVEQEFPKHALVVAYLSTNKILNFQIERDEIYDNDLEAMMRTYILIPFNRTQKSKNEEIFEDIFNEIEEDIEIETKDRIPEKIEELVEETKEEFFDDHIEDNKVTPIQPEQYIEKEKLNDRGVVIRRIQEAERINKLKGKK